eukprot:g39141.t1
MSQREGGQRNKGGLMMPGCGNLIFCFSRISDFTQESVCKIGVKRKHGIANRLNHEAAAFTRRDSRKSFSGVEGAEREIRRNH